MFLLGIINSVLNKVCSIKFKNANSRYEEISNIENIWKERNEKRYSFIKSVSLDSYDDYKKIIEENVLNNKPIIITNLQSKWNNHILRNISALEELFGNLLLFHYFIISNLCTCISCNIYT